MRPRDVGVYLLDALAAAEQIVVIRTTVDRAQLLSDLIVRAAIERHFITIGEDWERIVIVVEQDIDPLVARLRELTR